MVMFHGGCAECTQQNKHGTGFCMGCRYFNADWSLPDLNNRPLTEAEVERSRLLKLRSGLKQQPTNAGTPFLQKLWKWIIGKNCVHA